MGFPNLLASHALTEYVQFKKKDEKHFGFVLRFNSQE